MDGRQVVEMSTKRFAHITILEDYKHCETDLEANPTAKIYNSLKIIKTFSHLAHTHGQEFASREKPNQLLALARTSV